MSHNFTTIVVSVWTDILATNFDKYPTIVFNGNFLVMTAHSKLDVL
jgi:hypothetical protein